MDSPPAAVPGGEAIQPRAGGRPGPGREERYGGQVEGVPRHDGGPEQLGEPHLPREACLCRAHLHDTALDLQPEGVLLAARAEADLRPSSSTQVTERRLASLARIPCPGSAVSTAPHPASRGAGPAEGSPISPPAARAYPRRFARGSSPSRSRRRGPTCGYVPMRTGISRPSVPTPPDGGSTCITSVGASGATRRSSTTRSSSHVRFRTFAPRARS